MSRLRFILIAGAVIAAMLWVGTGSAATTTVNVGDFWFCSAQYENGVCETEINAGDAVVWNFDGSVQKHTTTDCGASCDDPTSSPLWESGLLTAGTFRYRFTEPGIYPYYCRVHPTIQRGQIVVVGSSSRIGDVDCDRDIDSIDAALLLQHGAGLLGSLPCQQNADTNADGTVNSIDAALVLQYVAGFLDRLPP